VIKTFAHKGLEAFFLWDNKRGIQPAHARRLAMILDQLDIAGDAYDVDYLDYH